MEKMSYKGWVWPQNPEKFEQFFLREPVYVKNSSDVMVFTGMGPMKRTFTGSGTFFGSTAFEDFKALAALFAETTCGALVHPVWGTFQAYFTELEMTQEPRENEVAYRFTFREADANDAIPK